MTIRDVAARAGVSAATVSRVFSRPESVTDETRRRVLTAADDLRYTPHPTHTTVDRAIRHAEELAPKRTFFTHICHDLPHAQTESRLPQSIRLAYDGLVLDVGGPAS